MIGLYSLTHFPEASIVKFLIEQTCLDSRRFCITQLMQSRPVWTPAGFMEQNHQQSQPFTNPFDFCGTGRQLRRFLEQFLEKFIIQRKIYRQDVLKISFVDILFNWKRYTATQYVQPLANPCICAYLLYHPVTAQSLLQFSQHACIRRSASANTSCVSFFIYSSGREVQLQADKSTIQTQEQNRCCRKRGEEVGGTEARDPFAMQ